MSIFSDAADVIRERGWAQDVFEESGGVCVWGALRVACHGHTDNCVFPTDTNHCGGAFMKASNAVGQNFVSGLPDWNDANDRTLDDVLRLLKELDEEYGPVQS